MDLIGLKIELQERLGRDVDVLTYDSINPLLAKSIKSDEVKIYG
jgi:predicted nucleotidyltransferase